MKGILLKLKETYCELITKRIELYLKLRFYKVVLQLKVITSV